MHTIHDSVMLKQSRGGNITRFIAPYPIPYNTILCHVIRNHVMSCHVIESHHFICHHLLSYHVVSCNVSLIAQYNCTASNNKGMQYYTIVTSPSLSLLLVHLRLSLFHCPFDFFSLSLSLTPSLPLSLIHPHT